MKSASALEEMFRRELRKPPVGAYTSARYLQAFSARKEQNALALSAHLWASARTIPSLLQSSGFCCHGYPGFVSSLPLGA